MQPVLQLLIIPTIKYFFRKSWLKRAYFCTYGYNSYVQRYGPYKVISRTNRVLTLNIRGQKQTLSNDRLRSAFFLSDDLQVDPVVLSPSNQIVLDTRHVLEELIDSESV
ncbi:hypothetical protein TNCT_416841 [Trichonephila clavata]|uniref:Uncharacterized protein n=1 Tax=Trichonephila clavata TaxID=2740835 RepID=A0A8X6HZ69_TRICU|nr:hypothetical protein TNCT_416841 [Trichonephila clavata]